MTKLLFTVAAALTLGASTTQALAAQAYVHPSEHFSLTVPDGLVPLTAAELARGNAATAAEGGTPKLYEAGFASPAGGAGPRLPLVKVRFVRESMTFKSFADGYRADLARAATQPAAAASPAVSEDETAHSVSIEFHRKASDGSDVIERRTMFVGHDGVAEIDYTGAAVNTGAQLPTLLASFKFDKGFEYNAPEVYVVKTAAPTETPRRTLAAVILVGGSVLFLAVAVGLFLRARQRRA